jgi:isohexenylglutaconyl-CoA hydratase
VTQNTAIEVERTDLGDGQSWGTIWFNQPEMRNPMSDAMVAETIDALAHAATDRSIRGITLRGRGKVFSAGGNLKQFADDFQASGDRAPVLTMSRGAAAILDAVANQPQLTVAMVHGAAVAGGLGIVCACDYVIAHETTKFTLTETMIGLTPAQIAPFVINKLGYNTAKRLMLTAAILRGHEAHELGLIDKLCTGQMMMNAEEIKLRQQMLKTAPGAVASLKQLLRELPGKSRQEQINLAADNFTDCLLSDEAVEGIASFFEKRQPSWVPK